MKHWLLLSTYGAAGVLLAIALALRAPVFGVSEAQASVLPWYLAAHAGLLAAFAAVVGTAARMAELSLMRIVVAGALAMVLLGLAMIDVVVGCEGLMHLSQGGGLAIVLLSAAVASGAAMASFFGSEDAAGADERDEKTAALPAVADEGRPTLRSAAIEMGGTFFWAVIAFAGLAVLALGFLLYYALRASLFEDLVVDLGLLQALHSVVLRIWPVLVVPVVVMIGYGIATTLGRVIPQAIDRWRYPRVARDLGAAELAFIDKASAELDAYILTQGFKRSASWLSLASFSGIALAIVMLFAAIWYRDQLAMLYAPPSVGAGWHLLTYHFPGSAVPAMFLCLWLFWPLRSLIGFSSRHFSELLTWYSYSSSQGMFSLRKKLVRDVRVGTIRSDLPFKPGDFLHRINLDWTPFSYISTGALILLTAVLWDRDARDYTLYAEDRIEVVDYWTSAAHSFPYSAAARVELECAPRRKGGWEIGYHIALSPDLWVDLMEDGPLLPRLADYEQVNARLVATGAKFDFRKRNPTGREPFIAYSAACVEETIKDLDAAEGARVAALLHLGDWQARSGASR